MGKVNIDILKEIEHSDGLKETLKLSVHLITVIT